MHKCQGCFLWPLLAVCKQLSISEVYLQALRSSQLSLSCLCMSITYIMQTCPCELLFWSSQPARIHSRCDMAFQINSWLLESHICACNVDIATSVRFRKIIPAGLCPKSYVKKFLMWGEKGERFEIPWSLVPGASCPGPGSGLVLWPLVPDSWSWPLVPSSWSLVSGPQYLLPCPWVLQ